MNRSHAFDAAAVTTLERLESRRLLSTQAFITAEGQLTVLGSDAAESIEVSRPDGDADVFVRVWTNTSTPDMTWQFSTADFTRLLVEGRGGNDTLWIRRSDAINFTRLLGGEGNDFIIGGQGGETLEGGAGNDRLYAEGGGQNTLSGGAGDDLLWAGGGGDLLQGGDGNDTLHGFVFGTFDQDRLHGNAGNDTIIGANSTVPPSHGQSETLFGGPGNDTLLGRAGDDILYDIDGFADSLDGGDGNDRAWRDAGLDEVNNVETIA